jgi:hypothetical protein
VVNGITVYQGMHGTFTERLGSNPVIDISLISVAGSF